MAVVAVKAVGATVLVVGFVAAPKKLGPVAAKLVGAVILGFEATVDCVLIVVWVAPKPVELKFNEGAVEDEPPFDAEIPKAGKVDVGNDVNDVPEVEFDDGAENPLKKLPVPKPKDNGAVEVVLEAAATPDAAEEVGARVFPKLNPAKEKKSIKAISI